MDDPQENSMVLFNFTSTMLDDGITFTFGSWICIANGSGDFNSHLSNTRKPEVCVSTSSRDIGNFIDDLGEFQLSDLIRNYASRLKAIPRPLIEVGDLIARVDRVGCNIAECTKLAEASFQRPGNPGSSTQNRSETPQHPPTGAGDMFSRIDQVDRSIIGCVKLAEATLHPQE
jgi:hypothetical protein